MSQLAGKHLTHIRFDWPAYGMAQGEVTTTDGAIPAGLATLQFGDLSFVVTVLPARAGLDSPATWHGVIMAGAGWLTKLGAAHADFGGALPVKLLSVLGALAKDCGETLPANAVAGLPADAVIGSSWSFPISTPALPFRGRDALALLRARSKTGPWYVDRTGVTKWGARPSPTIADAKGRIVERDLSIGRRKVSIDSPLTFTPGARFDGALIARSVITEDAGALTCETWES